MARTIQACARPVRLVTSKRKWLRTRTAASKQRRQVSAFSLQEFSPKTHVFSHCTIVCGVELDPDSAYIATRHNDLTNDNGNAWDERVLLSSYKTFIAAENYVEHIQRKDLTRGKLLDAVAHWKTSADHGRTLYVDILVATARKHTKLASAVESGRVNKMSMGCTVSHTQCSKCAEIFEDDDEDCDHLNEEIRSYFTGSDGSRHVVAELCGVDGIDDSNVFTEASWVYDPAFGPAERHGTIRVGSEDAQPLQAVVSRQRVVHAKRRVASRQAPMRGRVADRIARRLTGF